MKLSFNDREGLPGRSNRAVIIVHGFMHGDMISPGISFEDDQYHPERPLSAWFWRMYNYGGVMDEEGWKELTIQNAMKAGVRRILFRGVIKGGSGIDDDEDKYR